MLYHVSMIEKRKKLCERLWKASKPLQLLQVVFTILLLGGIWLWRHLINALILSAGRTAITSGDFDHYPCQSGHDHAVSFCCHLHACPLCG